MKSKKSEQKYFKTNIEEKYQTLSGSKAEKSIERAMEDGGGILRLKPAWVSRNFCIPGRRIKLHPEDYYYYGGAKGGIDERWLASTTPADNGKYTVKNEGLSKIVFGKSGEEKLLLLSDAVSHLKGEILGEKVWNKYKSWPMFSKFFDNQGPLPHHIHHRDKHAAQTGQKGKPEEYYFPTQLNNHGGDFPYTFFGINPGTSKEEVLNALRAFHKGDNKITGLSRAYKLQSGTGWSVPPGVLHAPGSLCTYEPQRASDVYAMYESVSNNVVTPDELLWKNCPKEKIGNYEWLFDVIDWDLNTDPDFVKNRFMAPIPVYDEKEMSAEGFSEKWICYKTDAFCAKELTVFPKSEVRIKDAGAYGLIMLQGHGKINGMELETPALIRFEDLTYDEYFVSERAAKDGVVIKNESSSDPIVMLKHFGPENSDWKKAFGKKK